MQDEAEEKTEERRDIIHSLEKGLAVIRAFDRNHSHMTLSDVSRRTGLTRATSRRLLHTLVATGYARTDGRLFELSPRVLELGYAYLSSFGIADVAEVYMKEVSDQIGEGCSLGVIDDGDVICVARVTTERVMAETLTVGTRLSSFTSTLGHILLAELTSAEIDSFWQQQVLRTPENVPSSKAIFEEQLEVVRQRGYAIVDEQFELGVRSIAVPIHDRRNKVIAAMSVGAHAGRVSMDDMLNNVLPVLRGAARDTERAIGNF